MHYTLKADEGQTARRIASAPAHYASCNTAVDKRFAVVSASPTTRVEQVERYLPSNYALMESFEGKVNGRERLIVIIGGADEAGWTLDGYVIPRLLSGLLTCEEIF